MRGSSRESRGVVDAGQSMVPYNVSWGELCPLGPQSPKSKFQPPGPPNVTVFGKRILADSSVKMRSHWSTMSPIPATAVLIRRGDLGTDAHTEGTPGEHKGRHGGDGPQTKEHQRWPVNPRKPREKLQRSLAPSLPKEPTLQTSESWTSGPQHRETIHFCLSSHPDCGSLSWRP